MSVKKKAPPKPQRASKYSALRKIVAALRPGQHHVVDVSEEEDPEKIIRGARSALNYGDPNVIVSQWNKGTYIRTYVCEEGNLVITAEDA